MKDLLWGQNSPGTQFGKHGVRGCTEMESQSCLPDDHGAMQRQLGWVGYGIVLSSVPSFTHSDLHPVPSIQMALNPCTVVHASVKAAEVVGSRHQANWATE